ncbi:MAG TPA: hypothetical protein VJ910_06495 [Desulfuromonadales bacterium]|nr:hypothetical protein [Desulfuromonadales bacterium]
MDTKSAQAEVKFSGLLFFIQPAELFDAPPVDPEIVVASPGRRTNLNAAFLFVGKKRHIINKTEQPAFKLRMQKKIVRLDDGCPGQGGDDRLELLDGSRAGTVQSEGFCPVTLRSALRRDAVRFCAARGQGLACAVVLAHCFCTASHQNNPAADE